MPYRGAGWIGYDAGSRVGMDMFSDPVLRRPVSMLQYNLGFYAKVSLAKVIATQAPDGGRGGDFIYNDYYALPIDVLVYENGWLAASLFRNFDPSLN